MFWLKKASFLGAISWKCSCFLLSIYPKKEKLTPKEEDQPVCSSNCECSLTPLSLWCQVIEVSPGSVAWTFNCEVPPQMQWRQLGDIWSYFSGRPLAPFKNVCPMALQSSCAGTCEFEACLGRGITLIVSALVPKETHPPAVVPIPTPTYVRAQRREKRLRENSEQVATLTKELVRIYEVARKIPMADGLPLEFPCPWCKWVSLQPKVDVFCLRCGRQRLCLHCRVAVIGASDNVDDATLPNFCGRCGKAMFAI